MEKKRRIVKGEFRGVKGDKTVTDETIEIPYEFLKESTDIFASWKTNY